VFTTYKKPEEPSGHVALNTDYIIVRLVMQ